MKKNIFILALLVMSLFSCEEKKIELFESKPFIAFERSLKDTTVFSFFYQIEDEVRHPFVVNLTGVPFTKDQKFKIGYDKEKTTLDETLFKLEENYIFRAGRTKDTIYVTMINHSTLETEEFNLQLHIIGYEGEVLSNTGFKSKAFMKVSDKTQRPAWWGDDYYDYDLDIFQDPIYWFYLGEYSEKKYKLFMTVTGETDLSEYILVPTPNFEPVRRFSLQFKHYLEAEKRAGREVFEDDGDPMKVEVIG